MMKRILFILIMAIAFLSCEEVPAQGRHSITEHRIGQTYRAGSWVTTDQGIFKALVQTSTTPPSVDWEQVEGSVSVKYYHATTDYTTHRDENGKHIQMTGSVGSFILDDANVDVGDQFYGLNNMGSKVSVAFGSGDSAIQGTVADIPDGGYIWATLVSANTWSVMVSGSSSSGGSYLPLNANVVVKTANYTTTAGEEGAYIKMTSGTQATLDATGLSIGFHQVVFNATGGNISLTSSNTIEGQNNAVPNGYHATYVLSEASIWSVSTPSSGGGSDDQVASEVPFTPTGNTTSTDVQAAIEEIQTELDGVGGNDIPVGYELVGSNSRVNPGSNTNNQEIANITGDNWKIYIKYRTIETTGGAFRNGSNIWLECNDGDISGWSDGLGDNQDGFYYLKHHSVNTTTHELLVYFKSGSSLTSSWDIYQSTDVAYQPTTLTVEAGTTTGSSGAEPYLAFGDKSVNYRGANDASIQTNINGSSSTTKTILMSDESVYLEPGRDVAYGQLNGIKSYLTSYDYITGGGSTDEMDFMKIASRPRGGLGGVWGLGFNKNLSNKEVRVFHGNYSAGTGVDWDDLGVLLTDITADAKYVQNLTLGGTNNPLSISGGNQISYSHDIPPIVNSTDYTLNQNFQGTLFINDSNTTTKTLTLQQGSGTTNGFWNTGFQFSAAKFGTSDVVIDPTGSTTINGSTNSVTITTQYSVVQLIHIGGDDWLLIGKL